MLPPQADPPHVRKTDARVESRGWARLVGDHPTGVHPGLLHLLEAVVDEGASHTLSLKVGMGPERLDLCHSRLIGPPHHECGDDSRWRYGYEVALGNVD